MSGGVDADGRETRERRSEVHRKDVMGQRPTTFLHDVRLGAGSRALSFTDAVGFIVGAAETLPPGPQAPVALGGPVTHRVTLLPGEVTRRGRREDDQLTASSAVVTVLQTGCIVQTAGEQ